MSMYRKILRTMEKKNLRFLMTLCTVTREDHTARHMITGIHRCLISLDRYLKKKDLRQKLNQSQ